MFFLEKAKCFSLRTKKNLEDIKFSINWDFISYLKWKQSNEFIIYSFIKILTFKNCLKKCTITAWCFKNYLNKTKTVLFVFANKITMFSS